MSSHNGCFCVEFYDVSYKTNDCTTGVPTESTTKRTSLQRSEAKWRSLHFQRHLPPSLSLKAHTNHHSPSMIAFLLTLSAYFFPLASLAFPISHPAILIKLNLNRQHQRYRFPTTLLATRQNTTSPLLRKRLIHDDSTSFEEYIQLLQEFEKKHGHARAYPERHAGPLADWIITIQTHEYPLYRQHQKALLHNETLHRNTTTTLHDEPLYLSPDRVKQLSNLGLEFRRTWTWEERIHDLQAFQQEHGHVRVPRRYKSNPSLGNWVSRVRQQFRDYHTPNKNTTLTIQQIQQLESMGFEWEIKLGLRKDTWQDRIDELLEFKKQHGHCRVPPTYQGNKELAQWVLNLRQNYRLREEMRLVVLSQERMDELEGHGFEWDTRILKWADRLEELREYAKEHGHVRVPKHYDQNPQLGRWTSTQRTQYRFFKEDKPSKLDKEQVQQLEQVGFQWCDDNGYNPRMETWEARRMELKAYQEEHDTIGVPQTDYSPLSAWYRYQRTQYQLYKEGQDSSLTENQVRQLEALDIDKFRDIRDEKWDAMLKQLKEYRDEHGHCRVPQQYAHNRTLGNWVNTIRRQYWKSQEGGEANPRLTDEKMEQLREIGFDFSRQRAGRRKKVVGAA